MRIINFVAIQWPWYELFNLFPIPFRFVLLLAKWSEVAQSCPTLCDPVDCSPPCSSVHGIFQARVLKWVATSFSRGYSRPRNRTQVTCIVSKTLYRLSHQGSLCCWYLILNSHFIHFCFIYSVLLIYISLGQCSMLIIIPIKQPNYK